MSTAAVRSAGISGGRTKTPASRTKAGELVRAGPSAVSRRLPQHHRPHQHHQHQQRRRPYLASRSDGRRQPEVDRRRSYRIPRHLRASLASHHRTVTAVSQGNTRSALHSTLQARNASQSLTTLQPPAPPRHPLQHCRRRTAPPPPPPSAAAGAATARDVTVTSHAGQRGAAGPAGTGGGPPRPKRDWP